MIPVSAMITMHCFGSLVFYGFLMMRIVMGFVIFVRLVRVCRMRFMTVIRVLVCIVMRGAIMLVFVRRFVMVRRFSMARILMVSTFTMLVSGGVVPFSVIGVTMGTAVRRISNFFIVMAVCRATSNFHNPVSDSVGGTSSCTSYDPG
ncbi:MAG: hypothetical protein FJ146_08195 [Deltaproteobacteria bacterium]|nr:hypothetical protein [Deltaproteobacteria bacterium]